MAQSLSALTVIYRDNLVSDDFSQQTPAASGQKLDCITADLKVGLGVGSKVDHQAEIAILGKTNDFMF